MKSIKKNRNKKLLRSVTQLLADEKKRKEYKKSLKTFNIVRERDNLLKEMQKYVEYATTRVVMLSSLKVCLDNISDKTEDIQLDISKVINLTTKLSNNIKEFKTASQICSLLNNNSNVFDAFETVGTLTQTITDILVEASVLENDIAELFNKYKKYMQAYINELNQTELSETIETIEQYSEEEGDSNGENSKERDFGI